MTSRPASPSEGNNSETPAEEATTPPHETTTEGQTTPPEDETTAEERAAPKKRWTRKKPSKEKKPSRKDRSNKATQADEGTPAASGSDEETMDRVRALSLERFEKEENSKKARRAREKAEKQAAKSRKPKTAAELRREKDKRKRAMTIGTRYGGDRWKFYTALLGLIALAAISLLSLMVALSKPSASTIDDRVDARLEESGRSFPKGEAVMWAGQVTRMWGTWDEGNPDGRAQALAPYLSGGMASEAGWNGKGKQSVTFASVNPDPVVHDQHHATVSAAYQTQAGNWQCIDIPVYAYKPEQFSQNAKWAFTLASNPTPIPCNPRTGISPTSKVEDLIDVASLDEDREIGQNLSSSFFPSFFAAWASSDQTALNQFTASGVQTVGLGGAMASLPQPSIGDSAVYIDKDGVQDGKTYYAMVPVTWTVSGTASQVSATYVVPIVQNGDRWFVAGEPWAAPQSPEVSGRGVDSVPAPNKDVTMPEYPEPSESPSSAKESATPRVEEPSESPSPSESKDEEADESASASPSPSPSEGEASATGEESADPSESASAQPSESASAEPSESASADASGEASGD